MNFITSKFEKRPISKELLNFSVSTPAIAIYAGLGSLIVGFVFGFLFGKKVQRKNILKFIEASDKEVETSIKNGVQSVFPHIFN